MIEFKVEGKKCIKEIKALCALWWDNSLFAQKYRVTYAPDITMYENLYDSGILLCLCGRNQIGVLIACYMAILTPYQFNPFYSSAVEIVWCIHPNHQKKGLASLLISAILKELKIRKVSFASLAVPAINEYKSVCRLLEKYGFHLVDNVYFKEINNG